MKNSIKNIKSDYLDLIRGGGNCKCVGTSLKRQPSFTLSPPKLSTEDNSKKHGDYSVSFKRLSDLCKERCCGLTAIGWEYKFFDEREASGDCPS